MNFFGLCRPTRTVQSDTQVPSAASGASSGPLPADLLCEALAALPLRVELSTPSKGVLYSNRGVARQARAETEETSGTSVRLTGGFTLTYWAESPLVGAVERSASTLVGLDTIPLEDFPAQAWVLTVHQGEVTNMRVNSRWAAFHGVRPRDASWKLRQEHVHPDDVAKTDTAWEVAIRTGCDFVIQKRMKRASDGAYEWLQLQAKPVVDKAGGVVGFVGMRLGGNRSVL